MNAAIDLTPLFEAMIALLFAVFTAKVLPLIQARLDDDEEARLKTAVHIAVYAAEKLYGAGRGEEKLAYAEMYIKEHCGLEIDTGRLIGMINAEIKELELAEPAVLEAADDVSDLMEE